MTLPIAGIGLGSMGGLGYLGLSAPGTYTSYDPMMYGMNGMYSPYGYGMMGMYYPQIMAEMQQNIEASQMLHSGDMHSMMLYNDVRANRETDSALIRKVLTNSDVMQGIQNLRDKVVEGDQDGICQEFDKLKNAIYQTYSAELNERNGFNNPKTSASELIEAVYNKVCSSDLRNDIKKYGDNAMATGFKQQFKPGSSEKYVDQTLNHCFGLRIDQKGSQDTAKTLGAIGGGAAHAIKYGAYGAVGAGGAMLAANGLVKAAAGLAGQGGKVPIKTKWAGIAAGAGLIAGVLGDAIWQIAKPSNA